MDCLPRLCCWTVLPDGVIQHNFSQKWCHFTCLCAWASEEIFPGGALVDFSKSFPRGEKVVKFVFYHSKLRNSIICWNFQIPAPLPTPICLCVGNVRATPLKIWVISSVLTPFQIVKFYWITYAKRNIWQINFNCGFVFVLATLNSYILFLHWQHNWHPYGQLASCYVCFVLSLHSGI